MGKRKKRPAPQKKRPIELTDDEALEHLFGKEARDRLKETARKADRYKEKSPHKWVIRGALPCVKYITPVHSTWTAIVTRFCGLRLYQNSMSFFRQPYLR